MSMGRNLRAGLIGLGMMGRHHARNLKALEGVDLVAVADAHGDPHGAAAGLEILPDVEALIAAGIDYAVVAVPTQFHRDVALRLAEAGGGAVRVALGVGDGDELDAVQGAEVAGVVAAHHAQADQARAEGPRGHGQAPAFATVFTAVTIRSRSASEIEGCTGSESTSRASISVTGRSRSMRKVCRRCTGVG